MSPGDLASLLHTIPTPTDPNVLLGFETSDDASVYRITDDIALVQSVDVLTPVVDDPYDFGRIAAANAVSDIYAMGAEPRYSLSFAGFPRSRLPMSVLERIVAGAVAVVTEAGAPIIGGHSIDDDEPKFGLIVSGLVHPDRVLENRHGRVGDLLVLTKPIGTGALTTAAKRDEAVSASDVAEAVRWMSTLNGPAARAMSAVGGRCATDVTGFGLLGHLSEITKGSGLAARIRFADVPLLPGARELADRGIFPGGSRRNRTWLADRTTFAAGLSEAVQLLLTDAQTSGGLLLAIAPEKVDALLTTLSQQGVEVRAIIGELVDGDVGHITVEM